MIRIDDPQFEIELATVLMSLRRIKHSPPLVVCVGTDRSTGDSLGPLVGTLLRDLNFPGVIRGTLDSPVHAENLKNVIEQIEDYPGLVIAVDACLGIQSEIGTVVVREGPLRPGLGVKKKLPPVGDVYIAGVVNVGGFMEYMVLQNTRLSEVWKMANAIARGLICFSEMLKTQSLVAV